MRSRIIGPPEYPDLPDEPIGCIQCEKEPPCKDDGEPDYSGWHTYSFCSVGCAEKYRIQMEAQNQAEAEMFRQWQRDEAEAREYFATLKPEESEEFGPDFR